MSYIKTLRNFYRLKSNVKRSREEIKELQDQRLRKLLHYAWEHSAYYRRTFERTENHI